MKQKNLQKIKDHNHDTYNMLKAVEELNELATVITQQLTKGISNEKIESEFGDVLFRLGVLKLYFDADAIDARANSKMKKSLGYIKTQEYENV